MVSKFQDKKRLKEYPEKEELLEYYTEHGNLELLSREERMNISSRKYLMGCYNNTSFRCVDKNCEFCKQQFPNDKRAKEKCETQFIGEIGEGEEGLFAKCDIEPGCIICQYKGRIIRGKQEEVKGKYVAMLCKDTFLDAENKRYLARYINHSCDSNCTLQKVTLNTKYEKIIKKKRKKSTNHDEVERTELWVVAKKTIKQSEEITFDYGEDYKSFFTNGQCYCSRCLDGQRPSKRKSQNIEMRGTST